jgi:hypothetical protein
VASTGPRVSMTIDAQVRDTFTHRRRSVIFHGLCLSGKPVPMPPLTFRATNALYRGRKCVRVFTGRDVGDNSNAAA